MADPPETTALRLAEAATEGPYVVVDMVDIEGVDARRLRSADGNMLADVWSRRGEEQRNADAAHIAHAHPGRVRAWLGAVARLRERAAEGHASDCVRRLGDDATVYRSSDDGDTHHRVRVGDLPCTCGHDLDLAALAAVDAEG